MRPPWATYGLVATLVGSGLLSAIPRMPGVDCLLATTGAACGSDLTAVGAVGTLAAAVGGWNVLSTAR
jgi:hypothetical protein